MNIKIEINNKMSNKDLYTNLDDNFTIVNLVSDDEFNFNLEEKILDLNTENNKPENQNINSIQNQKNIMNRDMIINQQPLGIKNGSVGNSNYNDNRKKEDTQTMYYGFKNLMKLCFDI